MGDFPSSSEVILCLSGRWRAKGGDGMGLDGIVIIGQWFSKGSFDANKQKICSYQNKVQS